MRPLATQTIDEACKAGLCYTPNIKKKNTENAHSQRQTKATAPGNDGATAVRTAQEV